MTFDIPAAYPLYLAGKPQAGKHTLSVFDKYSGEKIADVGMASEEQLESAIAAACGAQKAMSDLRPYERQEILRRITVGLETRADTLAQALCLEAGKPLKDSRGEVGRLIETFAYAAQEAVRLGGEVMNLEISPRSRGYQGFIKSFPIGPCAFISPFNFPLNLVAHKVAPAIAAGCPFVLKPASRTPIGALMLGEVLMESGLPEGAWSILPMARDVAEPLVVDPRFKLLSFTGSPDAGWAMKARAGKKKVVLELGGNAACVVDEGTDLDDAVTRIIFGAFYQSGQSCVSVQRVYAHASLYDEFKDRLVAKASELTTGDPKDETVFLGPLISEQDAIRAHAWVDEAAAEGAKVLCGGTRDGALLSATIVENVPLDARLNREEVFAPVMTLAPFDDFDEVLTRINDSDFGLQAGIFTRDIYRAQRAWETLEVGAVIIGDVPSWRADHMPYGGVKDSGMGREGIRQAIEAMSEERLMVVRTPPQ